MLAHSVTDAVRQQYYSASTAAPRALERSSPTDRRFGPNADAIWKGFKGELTEADRLDLLLREAAVYPSAFAPRVLFAWDGLTEDEPFGPDWESLPERSSAQLLRGPDARAGIEGKLRSVADAWALPVGKLSDPVEVITPATRFVVAGAGAIVALARHFEGRRDMDLAEQGTLVAGHPGERQLFGLASSSTKRKATSHDERGFGHAPETSKR